MSRLALTILAFAYCGDHLSDYNVIYIKGSGSAFADMDVDCDGEQNGRGDDGRCDESRDTQSITSFQWIIEGYNKGINDLNANVHPYVVFGNEGKKSGWKTFDPTKYGIEPLSVMAVVCNNKLVSLPLLSFTPPPPSPSSTDVEIQIYGIWGDENGDDGDKPMVGEASISLATACFGDKMTGDNGHDEDDVLYIAFPGKDAVPGKDGANWGAYSYASFESSIEGLGNKLISRIGGGSGGGTTPTDPGTGTCSWEGHCEGASCTSDDLCDGTLACISGKCQKETDGGETPTTPTCSWEGHCLGDSCTSNDLCDGNLACISGKCQVDSSVGGGDGNEEPAYSCEWTGHCEGAKCSSGGDCDGELVCDSAEKVCTMEGCDWAGHCLGAKCASHNDCSDPYECNASKGYCWHKSS